MHYDQYEITKGETAMTYEFVSQGPKGSIKKVVIYSPRALDNVFNLGFGDKNEETGQLDDCVATNNGDSVKVLATVASTVYLFTNLFPNALIAATGSTPSRTRLYRAVISNNLETIKQDFEVFGLLGDEWETFCTDKDYQAFLIRRKN
ncbi:hypothetical protein SAMN05216327_106324 [Dyadobacter sp. SG02]|uniref:DUF6934 family protein n=1 Tax=Dyadobacter sp. SG02 TaxID=1855291 RepID=UPI0008C1A89E|nr:hypothetical protein [Dyadobacter sp. SG02]SEJ14604.1 hypothetical protein SAMN05216327_106324 [Dyadobacter sp. SG02]